MIKARFSGNISRKICGKLEDHLFCLLVHCCVDISGFTSPFLVKDGILSPFLRQTISTGETPRLPSPKLQPPISKNTQPNNPRHPERAHLTSSTHDPHITMDTPLGKIGILICWDLAFPEAFRALITSGARLILIPCFWTLNDCSPFGLNLNPRSEALFLDSTLTARTFENTCGIVFANAGGPKEEGYAGLSQVVMPFTGPIMKMEEPEEGMRVCEIDMKWLDEAEKNYKVREDLAKEDWHYPWQ